MAQRQGLVGREQPSPALIQELAGLLIPCADVVEVDHPNGLRQRGQPPSVPSGPQPLSRHHIRFSYSASDPKGGGENEGIGETQPSW
jgi:hypothetical protein